MNYYCKNSSLARVIAVCVLTPLPTLACAILLECLPRELRLLAPSGRNGVFTDLCWGVRAEDLYPRAPLHMVQELSVLHVVPRYVGTCLLVSGFVGFPVPFVWQFGGSLLGVYIPLMVLLVFGRKQLDRCSRCYPSPCRFLRFFFAYIVLIELYPLYKVLCDLAPLTYRGLTLALLPVWRLVAENFIVQSTRQLEDLIPAMVTFSVDLFSMLFVSVCISTSGSIRMSVGMVVIGFVQSLLELRGLRRKAGTVLELLREQRDLNRGLGQGVASQSDSLGADELLPKLLLVARNLGSFHVLRWKVTRLWACASSNVSRANGAAKKAGFVYTVKH